MSLERRMQLVEAHLRTVELTVAGLRARVNLIVLLLATNIGLGIYTAFPK